MRCKVGDLAVTVGTSPLHSGELEGRIVRVVRRVIPGEVFSANGHLMRLRYDRTADWIIESDRPMPFMVRERRVFVTSRPIGDIRLRPIRNQPGEDETLQWAPVPGSEFKVVA